MFRVVQASLSEFIQIGQSAGPEDGSVDPALVKFVQRMQGNARSVRAPLQPPSSLWRWRFTNARGCVWCR